PPCKGPSRSRTGKPAAQPARMDFACTCGKPRPSARSSQPPRPPPYIPLIALASLFASHCLESRLAGLHPGQAAHVPGNTIGFYNMGNISGMEKIYRLRILEKI